MKRKFLCLLSLFALVLSIGCYVGVNNPDNNDVIKFTVTFESNGGSAVTSQEVAKDGLATEPTAPTKDAYTFVNWFSDDTLTQEYDFNTKITSDITIYANWLYDFSSISYRDLVSVTGGLFNQKATSGTPDNFDHTVSDFSIGKYEVTYELWYTVLQWAISNGYTFANDGTEGHDGEEGAVPTDAKFEPVTTINWRDTIVWCNAYSEMSGLTPVYTHLSATIKDSSDTNATACDGAVCNWSANGYRLPSEGEWQYAASNKGDTPYNYASGATANYNNATESQKVAWYDDNSVSSKPVGTTANPSALTLCDMSGNVWEWCWDWHADYPTSAQENYRGPASANGRIARGCSWNSISLFLQTGFRISNEESAEYNSTGFRVARSN